MAKMTLFAKKQDSLPAEKPVARATSLDDDLACMNLQPAVPSATAISFC